MDVRILRKIFEKSKLISLFTGLSIWEEGEEELK